MPDELDDLSAALNDLTAPEDHGNAQLVPPGKRPCPICGEHMRVESYGGASLDVCPAHGLWLDNGELHAVIDRARLQGTRRNIARVQKAKHDGKVAGTLLGVWSFLLD